MDLIFAKNISCFFNFTYQYPWSKNFITGNSGTTPGVAKLKGNAGLTYHLNDFLIITLSGNYVGNRSVPRSDPYGKVNGYFLANCNISTVKLFKEKITASLNIHNIFNTKWLDPGFRTADGLLYSTVLEQPGINGLFKIGISL
jgi:outer membrane receptor protein involved in Fe transport